jgi:hypothetical protein
MGYEEMCYEERKKVKVKSLEKKGRAEKMKMNVKWRNSEVGARFYTLTKLTESSVPGC